MYPSIWQILIILVVFLLLFGHKRIREFGKSLGEALRDFKKGMDGTTDTQESPPPSSLTKNGTNPQEPVSPTPSKKTEYTD